ncbi:MAG: DUF86 domain-containing protein [Planctomycetes bacterium]|nr:DUF86 domain-containing protein [Planctomycetota bacterium]
MNIEEIRVKIDHLCDNLEKLAVIPQGSLAEFSSDFMHVDSAIHRLQTGIQALIDVASYVAARRGLPMARTSKDILANLERAGLLPAGSTDRFAPMLAFRNRVVHLYDRVDPGIVYRILTEERGDLRNLLDELLRLLED